MNTRSTRSMFQVFAAVALASVWTLFQASALAQEAGGTLRLEPLPVTGIMERTRTVSIALDAYTGPPLTACQFIVSCKGTGKIVSVTAGESLRDTSRWKFASSLRGKSDPSTAGSHTALAVFYGKGLAAGSHPDVARITVALTEGNNATMPLWLEIHSIVAAHGTGDNAGVVAGPPVPIAYQLRQGVR